MLSSIKYFIKLKNQKELILKKIIFIRPGKHIKNGSLTGEGVRNIVDLSQKLKDSVLNQDSRKSILSSPTANAHETSNLLCRELKINSDYVKIHDVLGVKIPKNSKDYNIQISAIVEREVEKKNDILMIVTNKSVIKSFPRFYAISNLWGDCSCPHVRHGEAFILHFDKALTEIYHQPLNIFV